MSHHLIPYKIVTSDFSLSESSGILRFENNHIELEYQTRDAVLGLIKSQVKSITLSLSEIQDLKFKKGWFSDKLMIQAKRMKSFEQFPGSKQGSAELTLLKKYRKDVEYLVSTVNLKLSELRLAAIGEEHEKQLSDIE
jgi:hypothetical protein